ncbi:DUF5819 family protein [Actinoplanes sp. NPDC023801]|uniref:DUF5819 family protein n=1 Tax=Actinoplanes sp. NPDC023801 TaxID=3154595 RepID=UPI0033E4A3E3
MPQQDGDLDEAAPGGLRVTMGAIAGLCAAVATAHMTLVFLHVAPSNPVSQRLQQPIHAWVNPLFEQNWLLFAPNPNAVNTQIFARAGWMTETGEGQTSDWIDISSVDTADTKHNPYPSRTTIAMLRRAWVSYMTSHGEDEVSRGEWALMLAEYLRNIAVQRISEHVGHPFQTVRIKVVTYPIAPPDTGGTAQTVRPEPYTRTLPWWNATSDGS